MYYVFCCNFILFIVAHSETGIGRIVLAKLGFDKRVQQ